MNNRYLALATFLVGLSIQHSSAWDYEGHRMVNQIALASLPTNFPAFDLTPEVAERIAFLAGEPDRWRNKDLDLSLHHFNAPDHYIDIDDLADYEMSATNLSPFRYVFAGQIAVARAQNPTKFPPVTEKNDDKTRELTGFLPWTIEEYYAKLKSAFSILKTFEEFGAPEEIVNAQQNAIYIMGTMGHFVGDAGQPLHTTKHFNGWVGKENPKGYATNKTFHGWVDGGYIKRAGIGFEEMKSRVRPAKVFPEAPKASREQGLFPVVVSFIMEQHALVEPLYALNKDGSLSDKGEAGSKGRAFITQQLLKSGQFLGDLWLSAWETAAIDTYLKGKLLDRIAGPGKKAKP